jgi:hypothetical protein
MITVHHIHGALKKAGYSCALRFPTAQGHPDKPMPGYRITRRHWGWEVSQHDEHGESVEVEEGYLHAVRKAGLKAAIHWGKVKIPVSMSKPKKTKKRFGEAKEKDYSEDPYYGYVDPTYRKGKKGTFKFVGDDKGAKKQGAMMGNVAAMGEGFLDEVIKTRSAFQRNLIRKNDSDHPHAETPWYQTGRDIGLQHHGGYKGIRQVDDAEVGSRFGDHEYTPDSPKFHTSGSIKTARTYKQSHPATRFGKPFTARTEHNIRKKFADPYSGGYGYHGYAATQAVARHKKYMGVARERDPHPHPKGFKGMVSVFAPHPKAHILKVHATPEKNHPDFIKDVADFHQKWWGVDHSDTTRSMRSSHGTEFHKAVSRYAEHHGYDAIHVTNRMKGWGSHWDEVAWINPDKLHHVPTKTARRKGLKRKDESLTVVARFRPLDEDQGALFTRGSAQKTRRKTPTAEQPWTHHEPVSADHIVNLYNEAGPTVRTAGHNWYAAAHHMAKNMGTKVHNGVHKAAGVLAALSASTAWPTNLKNASNIMRGQGHRHGPGTTITGDMHSKTQRILSGEHHQDVLGGHKTRAFARLIEHGGKDPKNPSKWSQDVCIDRHALSIAVGRKLNDNDIAGWGSHHLKHEVSYNHVANAYRDAAHRLSKQHGVDIAPHHVQAVTWEHWRNKHKIEDNYDDLGRKIKDTPSQSHMFQGGKFAPAKRTNLWPMHTLTRDGHSVTEGWVFKAVNESYDDFFNALDEAALPEPAAPAQERPKLRLAPSKPQAHPHEGKSFYQKGKDLPTQYHGGPVQVRRVDPAKLDPQKRGSKYGTGFYTTNSKEVAARRIDTVNTWYKRKGGSITVKKAHPDTHILVAGETETNSHPDIVSAVKDFSPKYAKVGDMGMGDMTWKHQVNKFAEHHGYDAIRFDFNHPEGYPEHGNHTVVWKSHASDKLIHVNSRLAAKKGFKELGEDVLPLHLAFDPDDLEELHEGLGDAKHEVTNHRCLGDRSYRLFGRRELDHEDETHLVNSSVGVAHYTHCPKHKITYVHFVGQSSKMGNFSHYDASARSPYGAALVVHVAKAAKEKGHTVVAHVLNPKLRDAMDRMGAKPVSKRSRIGQLVGGSGHYRAIHMGKGASARRTATVGSPTQLSLGINKLTFMSPRVTESNDEVTEDIVTCRGCGRGVHTDDGSCIHCRMPIPRKVTEDAIPGQGRLSFMPSSSAPNPKHAEWAQKRLDRKRNNREAAYRNLASSGSHKLVVFKSKHEDPNHHSHKIYHVLHPSAKKPGIWQVSQFDSATNVPIGDFESDSREEAIRTLSGEWTREHRLPYGGHYYHAKPFGRPEEGHLTLNNLLEGVNSPDHWTEGWVGLSSCAACGLDFIAERHTQKCCLSESCTRLEEGYAYSCVLVDIPDSLASKVKGFSAKIPDSEMPDEKDIQSDGAKEGGGREQHIHVTALYGLHTKSVEDVRKVLESEAPIRVKLGKCGMFPASEKRNSDVLWVSVDSPDLHRINKRLRDELDYTNDYPTYKPHCTVAYLKKGAAEKYEGKEIVSGEVIIDEVQFSNPDGEKVKIKLAGKN